MTTPNQSLRDYIDKLASQARLAAYAENPCGACPSCKAVTVGKFRFHHSGKDPYCSVCVPSEY